jgi:hypothetical protein
MPDSMTHRRSLQKVKRPHGIYELAEFELFDPRPGIFAAFSTGKVLIE